MSDIFIVIKDRLGKETSRRVSYTVGFDGSFVPVEIEEKFKILEDIDGYGDTIFNSRQSFALQEDLIKLLSYIREDDVNLGCIRSLIEMCDIVKKNSGLKIWMYGD